MNCSTYVDMSSGPGIQWPSESVYLNASDVQRDTKEMTAAQLACRHTSGAHQACWPFAPSSRSPASASHGPAVGASSPSQELKLHSSGAGCVHGRQV